MLRIQMIGLAIMAALAMSAVAVSSASAEAELHQWLINGKLLSKPVKVHSLGLVLLEDTKALGGAVSVHCHGFDAGTVGPHGLDLIESITLELLGTKDLVLCLFGKNTGLCETGKMPVALALNLPWHTELVLNGGKVRDLILADGHGEPGWNVICTIGGKPVEDDCLAEAGKPGSTALANVAGGVLATFDELTPLAHCSIGGKEAGKVTGEVLIENPGAGEQLTFI